MSSFERDLMGDHDIPFVAAADFYIGIKKQAAPIDPYEEVEDAARKGVLAGITQSEKNILVDRDSRGERTGRAVGNVLGTAGGAVAGHKLLKGPTGALVGGALGYAAGGSAGKEVGRGRDIARHRKHTKTAAVRMRFKLACMKLADGPMGDMGGAMSSPTAGQEMQPVNYLQAEQLAQQAQNAQEGTFYRMRAQQAEQMAQQVQEQMAAAQQQLQELQMQAEQTGQQVQQGMQEALAARDDALKQTQIAANLRLGMQKLRQQMLEVASQDPAEVAASELQGQAQAEQEAQMAAAQGGDPAAAGGAPAAPPAKAGKEVEEASRAQDEAVTQTQQAEMAAGAPQPQGSPAPGATPSPSGGASLDMMDPSGVMKQGAARMRGRLQGKTAAVSPRLLGVGIGAGLGAAAGGYSAYMERQQAGDLRQRVQAMEAQGQGGFRQAMQLAALKGRTAMAEAGEQNPGAHTAYGALTGALGGAAVGGSVGPSLGRIAKNHLPYM